MPRKCYRVLRNGTLIETPLVPLYAGVRTRKRFCWPECRHVAGAKRRDRVFFLTWEDAHDAGYRRCKTCNPMYIERFPIEPDGRKR